MRTLAGLHDPFGIVLAVAAAITLLAFQEGPLVALIAAVSVLAVRAATAPIIDRWRPRAPAPPAPSFPPRPPGQPWYFPLSRRESEVAVLVADHTNEEIANLLPSTRTVDGHIVERTVDTHVKNIMDKLSKELGRDVNRRAQITEWVTERRPRDPVAKA